MQYDIEDRIPRRKWLRLQGISDSQEQRAREHGLPWPPYLVLGGRIYYSKELTQRWFEEHGVGHTVRSEFVSVPD